MAELSFENADVAAKYKSSFVGNPPVHQPGKKGTGFKLEKLSKISLAQADQLFATPNQNLLQLKDAGTPNTSPLKIVTSTPSNKTTGNGE